jgi:hypothetical protein
MTIIKAGWNAVPPGLLLFYWQMNPRRIPKNSREAQIPHRTENEIYKIKKHIPRCGSRHGEPIGLEHHEGNFGVSGESRHRA